MRFRILIACLFSTLSVSAQEIKKTQDAGLWIGVSAVHDFNERYEFTASQDLRLFESLTQLDKLITDFGLVYEIDKNFKLGGNLRYSLNKKNDGDFSHDFRYNLDLRFKSKLSKRVKFKYRLRFQSTYQNFFLKENDGLKSNFRNRIRLDYKLNKKHTFYISSELFREVIAFKKPNFNQLRMLIGDKFKTSIGKFDCSLAYERELGSENPLNFFFARVYYTFKIKK